VLTRGQPPEHDQARDFLSDQFDYLHGNAVLFGRPLSTSLVVSQYHYHDNSYTMNLVRKLAVKALIFLFLGVVLALVGHSISAGGRNPFPNVMFGVIIATPLCVITALVYGVRAIWGSFHEQNLDGLTLLLARGALPLVLLFILFGVVRLGIAIWLELGRW
jgi:hypothetical protein